MLSLLTVVVASVAGVLILTVVVCVVAIVVALMFSSC